jgi:hypothetical protein
MTILNVIGNLLTDGRQVEEFLLDESIFGLLGKLPIHGGLLPKIVIPVHDSSANRRGLGRAFSQARPRTRSNQAAQSRAAMTLLRD